VPFIEAVRERLDGVEAVVAPAEELPFGDATFDAALAQLVVPFMDDPIAGLTEMRRVTVAGGVIAASVWDQAGEQSPLSPFWRAVRALDPGARDESAHAGAGEGRLAALLEAAGLQDVEATAHTVELRHETFEDWWHPFTLGVGPVGAYVAGLDDAGTVALRRRCRETLPDAPFTLTVRAWAARGRA
jgi:SAM-dependent methyltransferase